MADTSKQRAQRRRQREYEARVVVNDVQQDRVRSDNRTAVIVLAAVAAVAIALQVLFSLGNTGNPASTDATGDPTATSSADAQVPDPALAENREWSGSLTLNDDVVLDITLDGKLAPQATANFVELERGNFFDDTTCHRLTTEGLYVLQCGDPTGTGTGGPGYNFGPLENVPDDGVYPAGTIAMARAAEPDSMGSQFFIVYEDTTLPGDGYTVFGEVTDGLDTFTTKIVEPGVDPATEMRPGDGAPAVPVRITDIELR